MKKNDFLHNMFDSDYNAKDHSTRLFSLKGIDIETLKATPINEKDLLNNGTGFVYDFETNDLANTVLLFRLALEALKQTTEKADTFNILFDKNEIRAILNKDDDGTNELIKDTGFIHNAQHKMIFEQTGVSNKYCLFRFDPIVDEVFNRH